MNPKTITIPRPSNMHAHLRQSDDEDKMMQDIVPLVATNYKYFVAMPNTTPPIKTMDDATEYRREILRFRPKSCRYSFSPLVPLKMLWNSGFKTTPTIVNQAHNYGFDWVKIYFRGTTTNSDDGVLFEDLEKLYPTFEKMEELGMILLIHGEKPGADIDVNLRELHFHDTLKKINKNFPALRIVFEHITDFRSVYLVGELGPTVAATITTHHLYMSLNDVLEPGPRGRNACKPYAKQIADMRILREAAFWNSPKFFFGDDNAPHRKWNKYCESGSCGCFHTHSIEFVTELFAEHNKLDKLASFLSLNGPKLYGLPPTKEKTTLQYVEEPYSPEREYKNMLPWGFERKLHWKIK